MRSGGTAIDGLDLSVAAAWVCGLCAAGLLHTRRAGRSEEEFFAAGRRLPWWLAGTSIVATTFAADTPLAIAGLVATEGVWGNWFWWADVLPALIAALWIAELWRRSGVLTDPELVERRYAGRRASALRSFRAVYFGVGRNALVIAWVNLAMLKVLQLGLGLDASSSALLLAGLFALSAGYTLASGLWGVVVTDAFQFALAMGGSIVLAVLAVEHAGGLDSLIARVPREHLALVPQGGDAFWAFLIYLGVQSWAAGNTEGSGYVAQRLLATRSDRDARLAALWYAVAHFVLRPWPWILVGLVALVRHPGLDDPESGYVRVLLEDLPSGMRGAMLAALIAAYLSTIDTQLNWGASYLTRDLWERFGRRASSEVATERQRVRVARVSVVLLAALGALATLSLSSIVGAWKFLAQISAGLGAVVLARWLWWRVNAWSEIAVMTTSLLASAVLLGSTDVAFPFSLALVVAITLPVTLAVTLCTAPEPPDKLLAFYRQVRPPGWWGPVARRAGLAERRLGLGDGARVLAGSLGVYGLLLGVGGLLLGSGLRSLLFGLPGLALLAWVVRGARAAAPQED